MALFAIAGSKIFVGRRVAMPARDLVFLDFNDAPWLEVKGWASAGPLGESQEVVTQTLIGQGRARKGKGTRSGARMENTFIPMPSDPGQQRFIAAIESCSAYEFKIEWNAGCADEDPGALQADLFYGLAFPGGRQGGDANNAQLRMWAIEIVSNIIEAGAIPPGALFNDEGGLILTDAGTGFVLNDTDWMNP